MTRYLFVLLISMISAPTSFSQQHFNKDKQIRPFVAYEVGEAVFNRFQSLSGEVGLRFSNNQMIRLTHMNVNLTEQHLSTAFAGAVDGENVEGKFFGFEVFYDFPVFLKGLSIGPSVGYYRNRYRHIMLDEELENNSFTLGLGINYRETDLFNVKGLFYMFSIPIRTALNPINKTSLGSTSINSNAFDNNIWLFVGYEF